MPSGACARAGATDRSGGPPATKISGAYAVAGLDVSDNADALWGRIAIAPNGSVDDPPAAPALIFTLRER